MSTSDAGFSSKSTTDRFSGEQHRGDAGISTCYAFDGARYSNYSATTDTNGQAVFTLPQGEYRFRADLNGTQFWSGMENHCSLPDCTEAAVTVSKPVTVTVAGQDGQPYPNLPVYAFARIGFMITLR